MVLAKYRSKLIKKDARYLFLLIPFLIFIAKNLLGTGCIIYPMEISCINSISWTNNDGARELSVLAETFNKSWSNYKGNLSEIDYVKNFNWVSGWINRYFFFKVTDFLFGLLFLSIVFLTTFYSKIRIKKNVKT